LIGKKSVTLNDPKQRNGYYLSKHDGRAVLFAVAELLVYCFCHGITAVWHSLYRKLATWKTLTNNFYRAAACNATHGIAWENRLSVSPSNAWVVTKRKEDLPTFLY